MSTFHGKLRRTVLISVLALIVLGGVSVGWWFVWVPNWRPPLRAHETYGVDVSAHQGTIAWEEVARDDISFAYIKATEGGDFIDDRFLTNWSAAEDVGLPRGAYHFFTLCTPGKLQAENFLRVARPDPVALAPAVDLELAGNCSARPPDEEVARELDAFLETVESEWDQEMVLYVGNDWREAYPIGDATRPLWLRRFLVRPSEDWHIWQLHGYAAVDGIAGGADLNVMRRDA